MPPAAFCAVLYSGACRCMRYLKLVELGESPVADGEKLEGDAAARERLAIGLRRIAGVSESDFKRRTGSSIHELLGELENQWVENGLLVRGSDRWQLTSRGIMVCDWIAGEILGRD